MKKRRPPRLPLSFGGGWLTWFALIFATSLTLNEALGAPSTMPPFTTYRYSQDDLGATYSPQATTMKLWAPTAGKVDLALFDDAITATSSLTPMTRDADGIWSVTINGNLDGKYYLYQVALQALKGSQPKVVQVNDPYARG
jgi:1,4-alpha-glucan branching enzyme